MAGGNNLDGHCALTKGDVHALQVKFEPENGAFMMSAGYDKTVKLWSARNWQRLKTLAGHEDKVMSADVSPSGEGTVASVGYDRTLKLWTVDAT